MLIVERQITVVFLSETLKSLIITKEMGEKIITTLNQYVLHPKSKPSLLVILSKAWLTKFILFILYIIFLGHLTECSPVTHLKSLAYCPHNVYSIRLMRESDNILGQFQKILHKNLWEYFIKKNQLLYFLK